MTRSILVALIVLFVIALVLPRAMSDGGIRWHVDPTTVEPPDSPNTYLVAGHDAVRLPFTPEDTLARIDAIALAEARVSRLVHDEDGGQATYVQRSAVFGFPDYISARVEQNGAGSRVSIYSRSRFGHSDLGVNKARVERWLKKLESNAGTN